MKRHVDYVVQPAAKPASKRRDGKRRHGSWRRLRERLRLARGIWRCEQCGAVAALEAHHVVPVSVDRTRELDPSNIRFLCVPCHDGQHNRLCPLSDEPLDVVGTPPMGGGWVL